jgi:hypothetical protein
MHQGGKSIRTPRFRCEAYLVAYRRRRYQRCVCRIQQAGFVQVLTLTRMAARSAGPTLMWSRAGIPMRQCLSGEFTRWVAAPCRAGSFSKLNLCLVFWTNRDQTLSTQPWSCRVMAPVASMLPRASAVILPPLSDGGLCRRITVKR